MKPRRSLLEYTRFRNVIDKYTGRRLLTKPLRPVYRLIPSPTATLLRVLGL